MELRHLRYFLAIADERTFVGAAERLHVAQPALSRQIRDLEEELGAPLLERGARGVTLTAAGEVCAVRARHLLAEAAVAVERARLASRGAVGHCVIAAGRYATLTSSLADIVSTVREHHPAIDLEFVELNFLPQWEALRSGEADIGLGVAAPAAEFPELESIVLVSERFDHAVVGVGHLLASRKRLGVADLRRLPPSWPRIFPGDGSEPVAAECARVGLDDSDIHWVSSFANWLAAVRAGQAMGFAPAGLVGRLPTEMVAIPLDGFAFDMAYCAIVRRTDDRPLVRTVLELIRRAHARAKLGEAASGDAGADEAPPRPVQFELRHLRYFVAVAEEGGFGRAAQRLGVTQPALSRQLRDLEREVGVRVLERAARGAVPTLAGASFLRDARRLLELADALPAEVQRARRGTEGRCIVAIVETPRTGRLVATLLRRAGESLPGVTIDAVELTAPAQIRALAEARIDIGLAHASPTAGVATDVLRIPLLDDALDTAILPARHPLVRRPALRARELAAVPLLFMRRRFHPDLYDAVFAALRGAGLEPLVEGEYDGLETTWALAAEGRGWVLGARSLRDAPPPGTVAVPLTDVSVPWELELLHRGDERRDSVLRIIELLRDASREGLPSPATPDRALPSVLDRRSSHA